LLRPQFRALVQVCMTSSSALRTLAPALLQEAREFLAPRLPAADVAELYLEQHQAEETAAGASATDVLRQDLLTAHTKAAPELCGTFPASETFILSVPPGPSGQELRDLTRQALARKVDEAVSADEIVFYRELNTLALADLQQTGPAAQE